jgi:hypothetical protein
MLQFMFLLLNAWIGIQFYLFIDISKPGVPLFV